MTEGLLPEFERLYAEWRAAMERRDRAWFAAIVHPRFRYTGIDGTTKGKEAHLAQVTSAVSGEFRTELRSAERFGEVAIVTGRHWARVEVDDSAGLAPDVVARMRAGLGLAFTTVWLETAGGWRALAHHTTALAA